MNNLQKEILAKANKLTAESDVLIRIFTRFAKKKHVQPCSCNVCYLNRKIANLELDFKHEYLFSSDELRIKSGKIHQLNQQLEQEKIRCALNPYYQTELDEFI